MTLSKFKKLFPILVPSFVVTQLERHGLPSSTLLDLDKLCEVCSMEDVVLMYCLNTEQEYTEKVFGPGHMHTGLAEYWHQHYGAQLSSVLELVSLYRGVLEERLFFESSEQAAAKAPLMLHVEFKDPSVSAIVIILRPGQLRGADQRETQKSIVREYMRQSYAFTDYAALAKDPLFERYFNSVTLDNVSEPA
jgi:hypothetical protein